jgi:hypothetical protein
MPTIEGARFRGGTTDMAGGSTTQPLIWIASTGAPTAATGAGTAGKGSLCTNRTSGDLYVNKGTLATPDWKLVTVAV